MYSIACFKGLWYYIQKMFNINMVELVYKTGREQSVFYQVLTDTCQAQVRPFGLESYRFL